MRRWELSCVGNALPTTYRRSLLQPRYGTFSGVTAAASALKMMGIGLTLFTAISEFTITTITAFFSGR